ncbi:ribosomal protein 60S [Basidiobolus meristosporus CBS 931.73]|uniref:Ribosomal protein 60S n=1 Tax=Basidiobolus meristosporus CBS 931.73 TaxID=1314790 RepID=A0A1Y1WV99_9FUNG|nr:ribosomal protein 60S [Basidiobolus meristosporus CBS 931.73]|eukprot:ORX77335.1 ribosomal protein 60S [Basidiobolus meristosporus CBS 931.73]
MSAEQAIVYASLILQDDGVEITSDKLTTLIKAAGVEVEPIWASLFAKALAGKNLSDLLMNVGSAGSAPAAATGASAAGSAEAAPAAEEKEEAKEESDDDMGFGLFD